MIMSNETERTLHELKLPGMASCWSSLEETHQLDKLTLREGMQIMLQHERDTRGNNRIQRLIKNAGFRLRASMEELETDTEIINFETRNQKINKEGVNGNND